MQNTILKIKRVYDEPESTDGKRVLVDRLWPRGVRRAHAHVDVWMKEISPSPDLRKWFCHDPERFEEFRARYKQELAEDKGHAEAVKHVMEWCRLGPVTLLYAAKDPIFNNAVVLLQYLQEDMKAE